MDLSTIAIGISSAVGLSQLWKTIKEHQDKKDEKKEKTDDKLSIFAKNAEVKTEFDKIKEELKDLKNLEIRHAVLEERVDNILNGLNKIESKIDTIIEHL
jgi:predicted nuclease with TOPRIM domain